MEMRIGPTLATIGELRSGIARSCHIGNNTANNWAWLALAPNTQMIQFDHTLYGMDEVAVPWVLLGDRGIIDACYDHRGRQQTQHEGLHINCVLPAIDRGYLSHLNYGIFADHRGEDLVSAHCRTSDRLCKQINDSSLTFDSTEILAAQALLRDVIRGYARLAMLDRVFDRWVRTARKGQIIIEPLRRIETKGADQVCFIGMNGETLFDGELDRLVNLLFEGMAAVTGRLLGSPGIARVSYPWLTLSFTYLVRALKEYQIDPHQRTFWHAGGSASSYYINGQAIQVQFDEHRATLTSLGYIPQDAHLRFVPTYCAQLFALNTDGLGVLSRLLALWLDVCRAHKHEMDASVFELGTAVDPSEIVMSVYRLLTSAELQSIRELQALFNEQSQHRLPIAHVPRRPIHRTYNKYGIAQRHLLEQRFLFPENLGNLSWGEAELFVKILGLLALHEPE
jgi:hypothetical protein